MTKHVGPGGMPNPHDVYDHEVDQGEVNQYDEIERQLIFSISDLRRTCNSMAQIQDVSPTPFAMPIDKLVELHTIIGDALEKHSVVGKTFPAQFQQHMLDVDQQKRLDQIDADKARGE